MFAKAKKDVCNVISVFNKSSFQRTPEELYFIYVSVNSFQRKSATLNQGFSSLLSGVHSPKLFWLKRERVGNSLQSNAFPRRH